MKHGAIHLHIDELVLDGFNPADRHRIGDGLERELVRVLTAHGFVATENIAAPNLVAPEINVARHSQPGAVGRQIAGSVLGALSNGNPSSVPNQGGID